MLQAESHAIDIFKLAIRDGQPGASLVHTLTVRAPSALLDAVWYPFASCDNPASWCFAMSIRDVPIRLVDASLGRVSLLAAALAQPLA